MMTTSYVELLREELRRAEGRIWSLDARTRRRVLRHLSETGPEALADLIPQELSASVPARSADVVWWYVRWVAAHLTRGERPSFNLSDDAMCDEGPRVLLVSPVYRLNEASIGLVRISFFLRGLGIHADWVAASPDSLDEILRRVEEGHYDVIGQGTTDYTFDRDMLFLARMSEASPRSSFVLGGHGAVFEPQMCERVLSTTPVSFVVRGFGERSTARLAIAQVPTGFGRAMDIHRIPGIHMLHRGQLHTTGVDSYSELEFRVLHAVFDSRHYPVDDGLARLATSTHCPFRCVFCSSRTFTGQAAVRLDPSDVVHMVAQLRRHHPELAYVEFNDDNFSGGYQRDGRFCRGTDWLRELCEAATTEVFDGLRTFCYSRSDTIDRETMAGLAKHVKLARIGIGLEHVSHSVLGAMKKGIDVREALARIHEALRLGLDTNFFVILFSKWETRESLRELIETSSRLALGGAHVVYNWGLQPLRGADVSKDPTNEYLSSMRSVGAFHFEQRGKVVPDDPQMAVWFRHMNENLGDYFALQDELLARVAGMRRVTELDARSPWLGRIFRRHHNVNLSNTLTNLVRFHSMFEYGRRCLGKDDPYFVEGAHRTWGTVLAYVFNGPTHCEGRDSTSIERKIDFLSQEVSGACANHSGTALAIELDVARVGMRAPNHVGLVPGPTVHRAWAIESLRRWRDASAGLNPDSEVGGFARDALEEIEAFLAGRVRPVGSSQAVPAARSLDYVT